jgi:hypothetical protein
LISLLSFKTFNTIAVDDKLSHEAIITEASASIEKTKYEKRKNINVVIKNCNHPYINTYSFILSKCFTENSSHIVNIRNTIQNSATNFKSSFDVAFQISKIYHIQTHVIMYPMIVGIQYLLKKIFKNVEIKIVMITISSIRSIYNKIY